MRASVLPLLIFTALQIFGTVTPAEAGCLDWLLGHPSPAKELLDRVRNTQAILAGLEIQDIAGVKPIGFLGQGVTATTMRVQLAASHYALKLYTGERPHSNAFYRDWVNETSIAIIIQQYLAEKGMAPKVIGVFSDGRIDDWVNTHLDQFSHVFPTQYRFEQRTLRYGLVMEEIVGITSKDADKPLVERDPIRTITRTERKAILKQAKAIDKAFFRYNILPEDIDVVLKPNGQLQLIDLAFYKLTDSAFRGAAPRAVEQVTKDMLDNPLLFKVVR